SRRHHRHARGIRDQTHPRGGRAHQRQEVRGPREGDHQVGGRGPGRVRPARASASSGARSTRAEVIIMPSSLVNLFTVATLSVVAGCIPQDDYEGTYDMTFDVITTSAAGKTQAMAGTTTVDVKHGLNDNYLVHLGNSFCVLEGSYIKAEKWGDKPYMDIVPQDCWYVKGVNA